MASYPIRCPRWGVGRGELAFLHTLNSREEEGSEGGVWKRWLLMLAFPWALASISPGAPETPSWDDDQQPSAPKVGGQTSRYRRKGGVERTGKNPRARAARSTKEHTRPVTHPKGHGTARSPLTPPELQYTHTTPLQKLTHRWGGTGAHPRGASCNICQLRAVLAPNPLVANPRTLDLTTVGRELVTAHLPPARQTPDTSAVGSNEEQPRAIPRHRCEGSGVL
jgi:hypothetical protein